MLQSVYFVSTKGSQEHEKELSHNCGGGYFAERSGVERNGTIRSKIRNGTGLTEHNFLSCSAHKKIADH